MNRTRHVADPTIPRKAPRAGNAGQRLRVDGPTEGWFVDMGGGVLVLTDVRGNLWPQERVRVKQGSFGFSAEGVEKAPRPWKYDGAGNVLVERDRYLVHFLDGDPHKPVVEGGIRSLKPEDPAFLFPQPIGQDPNALRMRAARLTDAGTMEGHVQLRALDGSNGLELVVGGGTFGAGLRIELNYDTGLIKIGAGGETHQVMLGDVVVQALLGIAQDLIALNAALPTLTPLATLKAFQLLTDATTSLSADTPFLSKITRVE